MSENEERLIRENERMRVALRCIRQYAINAVFGAWRGRVYDMATEGLDGKYPTP